MIPGIMIPPPLGRETGAAFVGSQGDFGLSSTLSTLGALSGDLLLCFSQGSTISLTSGGALTALGGPTSYRLLNGSDVAGKVSSSLSCALAIYRGPVSALRSAHESVASTVSNRSLAGFVKNAKHYGLVGHIQGPPSGATLSISSPTTFATRQSYNMSVGGGGSGTRILLCDRLNPVNPYYTNSAPFIWSASGTAGIIDIIELLTA